MPGVASADPARQHVAPAVAPPLTAPATSGPVQPVQPALSDWANPSAASAVPTALAQVDESSRSALAMLASRCGDFPASGSFSAEAAWSSEPLAAQVSAPVPWAPPLHGELLAATSGGMTLDPAPAMLAAAPAALPVDTVVTASASALAADAIAAASAATVSPLVAAGFGALPPVSSGMPTSCAAAADARARSSSPRQWGEAPGGCATVLGLPAHCETTPVRMSGEATPRQAPVPLPFVSYSGAPDPLSPCKTTRHTFGAGPGQSTAQQPKGLRWQAAPMPRGSAGASASSGVAGASHLEVH